MDTDIMKSINFEVLRGSFPELASLGGFAEQYVHTDPSSALIKMRTFVERMVSRIYAQHSLPKPFQPNLLDLLKNESFQAAVPPVVLDKFHAIRIRGNKAAHGEDVPAQAAAAMLRECFDLACWFHLVLANGVVADLKSYQDIPKAYEPAGGIKRDSKSALEKLATQEAQMQQLLKQIEEQQAAVKAAEAKAEELQQLFAVGQQAAGVLEFNEETTRQRLIDIMLAEAGWDVGAKGKTTAEVVQEEEVAYQPTETGMGAADYVLHNDDGKRLAVVEAKRTSKDANIGRQQAKIYADGLEKMHSQRPVIFYANGYDVWIWDDAQKYPPRRLFGFYSKDSLQYLVQQRQLRQPLDVLSPRADITNRIYQLEAIKRVTERLTGSYRKALVVQATGTGKTRVAVALTDLLVRAGWVKRVLFLCDRKELRKQAKNAFADFLDEPMTIVRANSAKDRTKRIYFATYPAMKKVFETFDVGFFDLIVADESHRSIYNRYGDLFRYFDCLQVGLTATPVEFVARNTYKLFECEDKCPTAYYPLERAVEEGYLVPYEVFTHTTNFLRKGIKYAQLTQEQREQLEEDGEDPEAFDYDAAEVDKQIFNKETNRAILRNLMEHGIREATGQHPGKSIIFARSHKHAVLLAELFDEMYPQYGGNFCQVIDNYDPRAEQLIDDFKGEGDNKALTIAISVDMLDTGIDIPEVVNLVFAKPIKSKVKFWQMIGRGTRLCLNLFGPGKDKSKFRIFDHWGNFEYFEMNRPEAEPTVAKPLMQQLFEARLDLAEIGLNKAELPVFKLAVALVGKDLNCLPDKTIAVREKWKQKATVSKPEVLEQFAPATVAVLRNDMAPLMQWIVIDGYVDAYEFDLLVTQMQVELLKGSGRFNDLKDRLLNRVSELIMHLNPVKEKFETIKLVKSPAFWSGVSVADLEQVRCELRGIIHHRQKGAGPGAGEVKTIDIADGDVQLKQRKANVREIDMSVYRKQVEEALRELFDSSPVLQKIRAGQPVSEADLSSLTSLVLTSHPGVDLNVLAEFYEAAEPLDFIIRRIIGMDAEAVKKRFEHFVQRYPKLTANQILFLGMLQNHISKYGSIEIDRLYEPPFTTVASDGVDGIFTDEAQIGELLRILETFQPQGHQAHA